MDRTRILAIVLGGIHVLENVRHSHLLYVRFADRCSAMTPFESFTSTAFRHLIVGLLSDGRVTARRMIRGTRQGRKY